jgi:hypothetical protein
LAPDGGRGGLVRERSPPGAAIRSSGTRTIVEGSLRLATTEERSGGCVID